MEGDGAVLVECNWCGGGEVFGVSEKGFGGGVECGGEGCHPCPFCTCCLKHEFGVGAPCGEDVGGGGGVVFPEHRPKVLEGVEALREVPIRLRDDGFRNAFCLRLFGWWWGGDEFRHGGGYLAIQPVEPVPDSLT